MHKISVLALSVVILLVIGGCKKDSAPANTGGAGVPSQLVGVWTAQSATVNGAPTDLATVLQWEPTTASARVTMTANGTYTYEELDAASTVVYTQGGTLAVSGNNITMTATTENGTPVNPPTLFLGGTWSINGNLLTLSTTVGSSAIVVVLVKS
ncbi:MAG: hypothetical protein KF749_07895 [Bacteroidetes bacterium]|nr:hypothetical protein [Bacteroidota bacterium]MCW5894934.1 hypothetical protein [Bacteroidota bacterium]